MTRTPCCALALVFLATVSARARTINVPEEFSTIQSAIEAAETDDEILVAPGEYAERIDFLGKAIVVQSSAGPTVTTISAPLGPIPTAAGSVVTFRSGEPREAVLGGFTVTGGTGTILTGDDGIEGLAGGGILVLNGSSPTIRDNVIQGNNLVPPADNTTLGGGMAILKESSPLVHGNEILKNSADLGGGIAIAVLSNPELYDNTISANQADYGGGILVGNDSAPLIQKAHVRENRADWGGGIYVQVWSPSSVVAPAETRVAQSEIAANEALTAGAGMCIYQAQVAIDRCIFTSNTVPFSMSGGWGGGLYVDKATVSFANSFVLKNGAYYGGGMYAQGTESQVLVEYLSIFENDATCGGGIALASKAAPDATIRNTIFWNNARAMCGESGNLMGADPSKVRYCDFSDGLYEGQNGNFSADPLFRDAAAGDLHLMDKSPCIDAGLPVELPDEGRDIDGGPRVVDGNGDGSPVPDVGADEFLPPGRPFRRAYVNSDEEVDLSDAITILQYLFLGSPTQLACEKSADVDDNAAVELTDAVYTLTYLFVSGAAPEEPFEECGLDPSGDLLTCESFPLCE